MDITERLRKVREQFKSLNVDGMLIPHSDEHQGEYLFPASELLSWLTGFNCSAGILLLLEEEGYFFLDSRYFFQTREHECARHLTIVNSHEHPPETWLVKNITSKRRIAIYPWHFSVQQFRSFQQTLSVSGSELVPVERHPVISAWEDRPSEPVSPAVVYPLEYAGESAASKIVRLAGRLKQFGCDATVINTLDDLAWLFNIRGDDIPYNMFVKGMGLLLADGSARLFMHPDKIGDDFRASLDTKIELLPADAFQPALVELSKDGTTFLLDRQTCPVAFEEMITASGGNIIEHPSIIGPARACRNVVEESGARRAQVLDCAALARAIHWIKTNVRQGQLTEFEVSQKLITFRQDTAPDLFMKPSFNSIVSSGPNATLGHYHPTADKCRTLREDELLLIDTGGQYLGSTTDITRTIAFKETDEEKKYRYSLVLKGLIGLSEAVFPLGTRGMQLDILAKYPSWRAGTTYVHGTGHGIGSYLGVHEGPHQITSEKNAAEAVIEPGMVFSNEPSFRIQGVYCMRIENDLLTIKLKHPPFDGGGTWLGFETLTYFPFEKLLLSSDYYDAVELDWINRYHQKTFELLAPLLEKKDKAVLTWLEEATASI